MINHTRKLPALALFVAALALTPISGFSQNSSGKSSEPARQDRWLHVRVDNPDSKEETVRVNVPLELAEKVLPTINRDRLQSGKVKIDEIDCHVVDLHALLDAVRSSKHVVFVAVANKSSS